MGLFSWLCGYLLIEISGREIVRFINMCMVREIKLSHIKRHLDKAYACVSIKNFRRLKEPVRKCHVHIKILKKKGFPFCLHSLFIRKILPISLFLAVFIVYIMSGFVWNISYEGNYIHTNEQLAVFLKEIGVNEGCLVKNVDCSYIELKIREKYTDISWVSAELIGTKLSIRVEEADIKEFTKKEPLLEGQYTNIVAKKDGIIKSIIVRNGKAVVKRGDIVKKGDILVTGVIEEIGDSSEVCGYITTRADADIVMQTVINYENSQKYIYDSKKYTGETKRGIEFFAFGKKIFSYSPSNNYIDCDIITETYQAKIGENIYLPFFVKKESMSEYKTQKSSYTKEEAKTLLKEEYERFIDELKKKDITVMSEKPEYKLSKTACSIKSVITAYEPAYAQSEVLTLKMEEVITDVPQ